MKILGIIPARYESTRFPGHQRHIIGAVYHDPHGTLFVVLADVGETVGEVVTGQTGHCQQEVMFKINQRFPRSATEG